MTLVRTIPGMSTLLTSTTTAIIVPSMPCIASVHGASRRRLLRTRRKNKTMMKTGYSRNLSMGTLMRMTGHLFETISFRKAAQILNTLLSLRITPTGALTRRTRTKTRIKSWFSCPLSKSWSLRVTKMKMMRNRRTGISDTGSSRRSERSKPRVKVTRLISTPPLIAWKAQNLTLTEYFTNS